MRTKFFALIAITISCSSASAALPLSPRDVRSALLTGVRIRELAAAVLDLPEYERAPGLIEAIDYRFPRGSKLVHFADLHRHRSNFSYQASIKVQIDFLHWLHAHPEAVIFAEGLTEDLQGEAAREVLWHSESRRWVIDFFSDGLIMPTRLEEFTNKFDQVFWERRGRYPTVVSFYPTPEQVALYSVGGPRAAFLLGKTERLHAAESEALNYIADDHRLSSNDRLKEIYTGLFREATALLIIERAINAGGTKGTPVLVFGKSHAIEQTFRQVRNLEIITTSHEERVGMRDVCRRALEQERRRDRWRGILKAVFR